MNNPIVYINPYYDPNNFSGGNRKLDEMCKQFVRECGDDFTLIVTKGMAPKWWSGKNLVEVNYHFNHVSKFKAAREIAHYLDSIPPSIVILESVPIPFKALKRHTHFQVAWDFRYFTGDSKSFLYRLLFSQYLKYEWRNSEYMITCSDFSISELKKYVGYDEKRVIKSFFGLDRRLFDILKQPAPEKDVDIMYVGHFEKRKNHRPLIEAISKVDKNLVVRFVGADNGIQKELEGYAKDLGLTNITFGRIATDDELWQLYRRSKTSVNPSLYEGFGMPLIEALALGVPTICADTPVYREVGGTLPTFFNPHDPSDIAQKLKHELESPKTPDPESVKKHVSQFFWENIYKKLVVDLETFSKK